jgi:hypothetical protein
MPRSGLLKTGLLAPLGDVPNEGGVQSGRVSGCCRSTGRNLNQNLSLYKRPYNAAVLLAAAHGRH